MYLHSQHKWTWQRRRIQSQTKYLSPLSNDWKKYQALCSSAKSNLFYYMPMTRFLPNIIWTQSSSMCWHWEQKHICDYFHPRATASSPFIPSGRSSWGLFRSSSCQARQPEMQKFEVAHGKFTSCLFWALTRGVTASSHSSLSYLHFNSTGRQKSQESCTKHLQHPASLPPLPLRWSTYCYNEVEDNNDQSKLVTAQVIRHWWSKSSAKTLNDS